MVKSNKSSRVVIQTAFIGDLFLSIPTIQKIKELHPEDSIILVCRPGLKQFFLNEKIVDEVHEIVKGNTKSYNHIIQHLNNQSIETIYCLHRSFRSAWMSFRIKAKNNFGFSGGLKALFFSKTVKYHKEWPDVVRQMYLLSAEKPDILDVKYDWEKLNYPNGGKVSEFFPAIPDSVKFKNTHLDKSSRQIAIFPGSVWKTKEWTVDGFAGVANALIRLGYEVSIFGGKNERPLAEQIKAQVPGVIIKAGELSLPESIEALKKYRLVIGNDSSPNHISAYLGIPAISVFGPTTLKFGFRPWNDSSLVVEHSNMNCRPCGVHGHQKCPLGHHKCMKEISSDMVMTAVAKVLKN